MSKPRIKISTPLATRLKALRQRQGITQEQLAERVGRCEQTIRMYENGRLGISPSMLDKLATALGTSSEQLL